jgi:hypothetical protein
MISRLTWLAMVLSSSIRAMMNYCLEWMKKEEGNPFDQSAFFKAFVSRCYGTLLKMEKWFT